MTGTAQEAALQPSLCLVRPDGVDDAASALRLLAAAAVEQGYAEPSFTDALLAREQQYPTGLPLPLPTAIPHADAVHVRRRALAALVPTQPLQFGEMGGSGRTVEVRLVLMLLVDDPAQQVPLLGRVLKVLQRPDLEQRLLDDLSEPETLAGRFAGLLAG